MEKQQDLPILGSDSVQCGPEYAVLLCRFQQIVRSFERNLLEKPGTVGHRRPVRLPLSEPGLRAIQGDSAQPMAELVALTQIAQLLKSLDEDVLHEVFHLVGATDLVQDDSMDEAEIPLDQFRKCFAVPGERAIDEFQLGSHMSPFLRTKGTAPSAERDPDSTH